MDSKLEKQLVKKYKFLRRKDDGCSPYPMFGIECGDGWYALLDDLCFYIERVLIGDKELAKEFRVAQIKEKYGTLRFYVYGGTDEIGALISAAEVKSEKICEDCGKRGKIVEVHGWLRTQCKKCAAAWKKERS